MGGFRIIQADGTSRRLSVNGLIPANARNILVQEIEDRSKGQVDCHPPDSLVYATDGDPR